MKKYGKKKLTSGLGVVLTASIPVMAPAGTLSVDSTLSVDAKQQTIEALKKFESEKTAAMASLLDKLKAQQGTQGDEGRLFEKLQIAAESTLSRESNTDVGDAAVYLKPQQAHQQ